MHLLVLNEIILFLLHYLQQQTFQNYNSNFLKLASIMKTINNQSNIQQFQSNPLAKYVIQAQIGRGASGICYKVKNIQNHKIYVMKKIYLGSNSTDKKNNKLKACLNSQVQILSKLNHPNIVKYYDSFIEQQYLYIIMEYASKGDLHRIIKRRKIKGDYYQQFQIWKMIQEILQALSYLHENCIVHRDVKCLNVMVSQDERLLLGDLGVSKILQSSGLSSQMGLYSRVGTPLYLPPEIIKSQKYDYKADMWGVGCIAYILSTFQHPFEGKNIITLGQNIVLCQPKNINKVASLLGQSSGQKSQRYSQTLNCFIMQLLQKNPSKRLSSEQALQKYFNKKSPLYWQLYLKSNKQKTESKIILQSPQKKSSANILINSAQEFSSNVHKMQQMQLKNNLNASKYQFEKELVQTPQSKAKISLEKCSDGQPQMIFTKKQKIYTGKRVSVDNIQHLYLKNDILESNKPQKDFSPPMINNFGYRNSENLAQQRSNKPQQNIKKRPTTAINKNSFYHMKPEMKFHNISQKNIDHQKVKWQLRKQNQQCYKLRDKIAVKKNTQSQPIYRQDQKRQEQQQITLKNKRWKKIDTSQDDIIIIDCSDKNIIGHQNTKILNYRRANAQKRYILKNNLLGPNVQGEKNNQKSSIEAQSKNKAQIRQIQDTNKTLVHENKIREQFLKNNHHSLYKAKAAINSNHINDLVKLIQKDAGQLQTKKINIKTENDTQFLQENDKLKPQKNNVGINSHSFNKLQQKRQIHNQKACINKIRPQSSIISKGRYYDLRKKNTEQSQTKESHKQFLQKVSGVKTEVLKQPEIVLL